MTSERMREIRQRWNRRYAQYPHALCAGDVLDLLALLDAERVRCADLERELTFWAQERELERDEWKARAEQAERERDEALVRAREAEWARSEWKADAKYLERERDELRVLRDSDADYTVAVEDRAESAEARVVVLEKALTYIGELDNAGGPHRRGQPTHHLVSSIASIARTALAVPGRPGSGAPAGDEPEPKHACQRCGSDDWTDVDYSGCSECREPPEPPECPHCHVELVDGTCVAGCYYRAPETQEDTP